ncbi:MAG: hypothetical protein P8L68_06620 [Paracoccaceae bacterium]|nr:hypothetical protein [Paracoccaceae bacterium]
MLFAVPMFLVPGVAAKNSVVVFVLLFSGFIWTFLEYSSTYPSLIEFRDAPPFNRVRFLSLLVTVYCLSLVQAFAMNPIVGSEFVHNVGVIIGYSLDIPGSPVNLMMDQFGIVGDGLPYMTFLASVGIAYFASLVSIVIFVVIFYVRKWPGNSGPFNVWTNMPTFDPTTTSDVVARLNRDARINIVLGFVLPFLIPACVGLSFGFVGSAPFDDSYMMIWVISGWAFLPSGMIMRGVALSRVAQMISVKRDAMTVEDERASVSVPV